MQIPKYGGERRIIFHPISEEDRRVEKGERETKKVTPITVIMVDFLTSDGVSLSLSIKERLERAAIVSILVLNVTLWSHHKKVGRKKAKSGKLFSRQKKREVYNSSD